MSVALLNPGADNDAAGFPDSQSSAVPASQFRQATTFIGVTQEIAGAGALGVRIKSDPFNSSVVLVGGPCGTDVFPSGGTCTFGATAFVFDFEYLTNTDIASQFPDLRGSLFPQASGSLRRRISS